MYYNFNPSLPEPFNVIHPYQLKSVRQLLANNFPDEIELIILFGGSLDLTCGKDSDLDLYVISENENKMNVYNIVSDLCRPLKKRFDILVSNLHDYKESSGEHGTVESKIKRKGVCIYAREEGYFA